MLLGRGFLGTDASLLADLSLVFGIGVALLLSVGVWFARRRQFTVHRWVQTTAVCLNLLQVGLIMVGSFARSAAPGVPARLGEGYYAIAAVHGLAGTLVVLLGTFVALRANELVPGFLRFHNYKLFMRTAYAGYLLVTLLGVGVYLGWYTGSPRAASGVDANQGDSAVVVPMAGFAFAPTTMVIQAGQTVRWVNQDTAPHTATADDGAAFGSDLLHTGESFSHTFDAPGDYPYFCELHGSAGGDGMSATIRVVAAGSAPVPVPVTTADLAAAAPTAQPTPFVPDPQHLPQQSYLAIQQLLVDGPGLPSRQGYAVGLHEEADELLRHAKLLDDAQANGDAAGVRRHAEHVYNLIAGSRDPHFGDLDGDGHAQNAGDGFGLLPNGEQAGYIQATVDAARTAETAGDATPAIRLHAQHVQICAANLLHWASSARTLALDLTHGPDAAAATRLLALATAISSGIDANGDGQIEPLPGEGGALVAYQHAQYMAGLAAPAAATAPPHQH
jgi:plastocyanin